GGLVAEADHEVVPADRLLLVGGGGGGQQGDEQAGQGRGDHGGQDASSHGNSSVVNVAARDPAPPTSTVASPHDQGVGWGAAAQAGGQQPARPGGDEVQQRPAAGQ